MPSQPPTITWITPERIIRNGGILTADRVDIRLRAIAPMTFLRQLGFSVDEAALQDGKVWARQEEFYHRDIYVFGKLFVNVVQVLDSIHRRGGKVVLDVCDNVFAPPEDGLRPMYDAALPRADHVVAASESLARVLRSLVGEKVTVISDPFEGAIKPPRFSPAPGKINLLWYGYPNGLPTLEAALRSLVSLGRYLSVTMTIVIDPASVALLPQRIRSDHSTFALRFVEWSQAALENELAQCDIVVIPTQPTPAQLTKTPNRILLGLVNGRYVVANPLPSYQEFADVIGLSDDLCHAVTWAISHSAEVRDKIARGQAMVQSRYDISIIGRRWAAMLEAVASQVQEQTR